MPLLPLFAGAILGAGAVLILKDKRVSSKLKEGSDTLQCSAKKGVEKLKERLDRSDKKDEEQA
ncbi:MAG: hypothetical protein ACLFQJ_10200 [Campylobacterales bacterium]